MSAVSTLPNRPALLPEAAQAGRVLASADILDGSTEVMITHRGEVYRLRQTKLGKLILTK
ncbi:hemin uptake protein HemP [Chthonobacter rhizosphaerae]|uniref:hemin uptake protein HemP n=1 Tax=Chthonobacter rhizosphaerae TaxID=2735553 RepID=UPI0015EF49C7|nr:hemin uptake protein HemP [Chthonobacter rhizosphaerae]